MEKSFALKDKEMEKTKKDKEREERYITICPKCGSTNIIPAPSKIVDSGFRPPYLCQDCGYTSFIFPEFPESEAKEVIRRIRAKKSTTLPKGGEYTKEPKTGEYIETAYGELVVHGWWKFAGPFSIIAGLTIYSLTLGGYLYAGPKRMEYALLLFGSFLVIFGLLTSSIAYFPSKVEKIFKKHPIIRYMAMIIILLLFLGLPLAIILAALLGIS